MIALIGPVMPIVLGILATQSPAAVNTRPARRLTENPLSQWARGNISREYGNLQLFFEPNMGQSDSQVRFLTRSGGMTAFLTDGATTLVFRGSQQANGPEGPGREVRPAEVRQAVIRMKLENAGKPRRIFGVGKQPGISNYFIGNDPSKWRTDVPHYGRVQYEGVYPGIDLAWYGNQRQLEYDFIVAPGGDPSQIQVAYEGVDSVGVGANGDLVLRTAMGEVRQQRPRVYQEMGGREVEVTASYVIVAHNRVGFEVARYDRKRKLWIDPVVLIYSTYLGGSGIDAGIGIAVDATGSAYITGITGSPNFPTQSAYQATNQGGDVDVFVTKLTPAGTALVYSTYLGGSGADFGYGIAVDAAGSAYVSGNTGSANFPTLSAYQSTFGGGGDAFVTKLTPAGNALVYSTYLGGTGDDEGYGIAVDAAGSAYATGYTASPNFPTHSAYQTINNGGESDAFVTKLTPAGNALAYSTYLGGGGQDQGFGIVVDAAGSAYVAGFTYSPNFPTRSAFQPALQPSNIPGGASDAFVTRLTPAGNALVYSTYLGGSGDDRAYAIAVDSAGSAYVTGRTSSGTGSGGFPTLSPFQAEDKGGIYEAFVTKMSPLGDALVYSTLLGGNRDDRGFGIAVDGAGSAYVVGVTSSSNFPTQSPYQATFQGGPYDFFVTKLTPSGTSLAYSTYLGGSGDDEGGGIAVDATGSAYVTGYTESLNFPTQSAYQRNVGGPADGFIAKIGLGAAPQIMLGAVGNSANYVAGKVAPGEIIVVYGSNFGPATLAQLEYIDGFAATMLGNTRIYFDNIAAPMIYAVAGSPSVLSCVVPYEVAGKVSTQVQVEYNGAKGNTLTIPVVDAVPAIFSLNQSGTGPGAILNWPDYTVNGASNRIAAGSYIMAFGTGEGKTDIAINGQMVPLTGPYPKPLLGPWTATVGSKPATVTVPLRRLERGSGSVGGLCRSLRRIRSRDASTRAR
jgi:uncharacterized protein (TIGR03437 family)